MVTDSEDIISQVEQARQALSSELAKRVVGQDEVIEQIMVALLANGHVLLTGVPGLGKTFLASVP